MDINVTPTKPKLEENYSDPLENLLTPKNAGKFDSFKILSAVCSAIRLHEKTNTPLSQISPCFSSDLESLITPRRQNRFSHGVIRTRAFSSVSTDTISSTSSISNFSDKRKSKPRTPAKKSPKRRKKTSPKITKPKGGRERKKRKNEWNDQEIILLLQVTKLMLDCELKSVAKALFELIERSPGKSAGRAAEKKLKRMEIFENWKKCNREVTSKRIEEKLLEMNAAEITEKVKETAEKYRQEEIQLKLGPWR